MKNVVIDNVLEAIHFILERNEFQFTKKQLDRADDFIIPFIDEVGIDAKEFGVKTPGAPKLTFDKRIFPLVVKYFAYIEDNMTLYEELMEDNYIFHDNHKIKFYSLDRILTGNFRKNEYKNMLLKNEEAVSSFYYSIRGLEKSEKEEYSKIFSDIVHTDHTTLNVGYSNTNDINNCSFLTKGNIELFGKEFLLKLNKKQRNIINKINFRLSEEDALLIKELFNKYPDYEGVIPLSSELLHNFSLDEINSMSIKDYILYETAMKNNLVDRVKEILKIDSSFDCPKGFIKEEIFRVLTNEEIIELSDDAKEKISNISIPEIDNVLIMPFSKINRIVLLDKANRKIDSIKNAHSK